MFRGTVFLVLLLLLAAVTGLLAGWPGAVTFDWLGYRVETSVSFLIFAILVLVVIAHLLWQFWRFLRRSPRQIARARAETRRGKAYRALTQGLVAVAAGDAQEARRQAKLAGSLLNDPPLTLLLAAQAAQLGGDEQAAERYFRAMLKQPETAFLGLRGLLMQAMRTGDDAAALTLARQAAEERPKAGWAVSTLLELELKEGDNRAAEAVLRRAERLKVIEHDAARRTRAVLLAERGLAANDPENAIGDLREAIRLAPELVAARAQLAAQLGRSGRSREAAKLIEQGWAVAPHPDLAAAYGALEPAEEPLSRVRRFERLAGFKPDHPESRLVLAAANLDAGLWGAARAELEKLSVVADAAVPAAQRQARLMARLAEAEGDAAAARRWLIAAAEAAPDAAWTCDKCGTPAPAWSARCGHCHGFDSLVWRAAPRVPALAASVAAGGSAPAATVTALPAPSAAAVRSLAELESGIAAAAAEAAPVDAARRVN